MTKARARERAKARAGKAPKKHDDGTAADESTLKAKPARFDPGAQSNKGPTAKAGGGNFARTGRGSARSG